MSAEIDQAISDCAPRAGSLAVTIFGDVVSPHGRRIWLGSLIEAMALFGINPRQARTAVFRLVREGWLSSVARGRRSYYAFTEFGQRQYAHAAERIYASAAPEWDGWWTLLMPVAVAAEMREELRRRLGWQGFGSLGGGLLAHPCARPGPLAETLADLALKERVVVWRARTDEAPAVQALVATAWGLDSVAERFAAFNARFGRLAAALDAGAVPTPAEAFRLRVLLVHEYRRILLATTEMPPALLGADWPGHRARALAGTLYQATQAAACDWCRGSLHDEAGLLPAPQPAYYARYGGLPRAVRARTAEHALVAG